MGGSAMDDPARTVNRGGGPVFGMPGASDDPASVPNQATFQVNLDSRTIAEETKVFTVSGVLTRGRGRGI